MSIAQKFGHFRLEYDASHPAARILSFKMIALLPIIHLSLQRFGLRKVQTVLTRWKGSKFVTTPEQTAMSVVRAKRATYLASQWPIFSGNCLSRSVLLWWILQRRGIDSELRIGVRQIDGKFDAHAWIEYHGTPLNANADVHSKFAVFKENINLSTLQFK